MPIYMVLMFIGNYSRRCYIKFWECVPALKGIILGKLHSRPNKEFAPNFKISYLIGVGYSIALLSIQHEFNNMFIVALSLDYIIAVLTSEQFPWNKCQFEGRHPECTSKQQPDYNRDCCYKDDPNCDYDHWGYTIFKYPPYDYLMSHQLGLRYTKEVDSRPGVPLSYFLYVGLLWLGVFFWLMVGLKSFRKVLPTINIVIVAILFCPVVAFTLLYGDQEIYPTLQPNYTKILTLEVSV